MLSFRKFHKDRGISSKVKVANRRLLDYYKEHYNITADMYGFLATYTYRRSHKWCRKVFRDYATKIIHKRTWFDYNTEKWISEMPEYYWSGYITPEGCKIYVKSDSVYLNTYYTYNNIIFADKLNTVIDINKYPLRYHNIRIR